MVIGIDASRANEVEKTGTEWYAWHVIQELKKIIPSSIHVRLYTRETLQGSLAELPSNWSVKVLHWPPKLLWTQLRLSWEQLFHRVDLLYIPTHTIPLFHARRILAVIHDVGFLRHHDLYDQRVRRVKSTIAQTMLNGLVALATMGKYHASEGDYHRFALAMVLRHASTIMTISEFSKNEIITLCQVDPHRLVVAPNGSEAFTCVSSSEYLHQYGVTRPYILAVGRIEEKKNSRRLVEAFLQLRIHHPNTRMQLVLCGKPGFGIDNIRPIITSSPFAPDIIQTGWVAPETLRELYCHAAIVVLPSQYEGFGIPLLEAMHAGIPIVAAGIPSLQEVGGDVPRYCNPTSTTALADALWAAYSMDEHERAARSLSGKQRAQTFSWQRTAQQTWTEMQKLLSLR